MARIVMTVDTYPRQAQSATSMKRRVISHGPPRPFHGIGKGKGGQEVRPPFYTSPRAPSVSLSDDAESRAKRRALLNAVADAALRHNVTIEGQVEYRLPNSVEAQREDLLREIRRKDAREEAQYAADQERMELRRKAEQSKRLMVCGKCAKVIATLFPGDEWRRHAEGCPERVVAWQAYMARNEWAKRGWMLRKDIAPPADAKAPKEEAALTKTDLSNTFNAAADAIAESKADRSHYMQAGDYSDQHK